MSNYIGEGVIDEWSEFASSEWQQGKGLAGIVSRPLIVGLWMWSSGGGWVGPHVGNQTLWPMTNTLVLGAWWLKAVAAGSRSRSVREADVFAEYCKTELVHATSSTALADCSVVHEIALLSQHAILQTRYCSPYDQTLQAPGDGGSSGCRTVSCMPTNIWLRDDRLGAYMLGDADGVYGNAGAIYWLHAMDVASGSNLSAQALAEKDQAVDVWANIVALAHRITTGPADFRRELVTTAVYGHLLSDVVRFGWHAMVTGYKCAHAVTAAPVNCSVSALERAIAGYDTARATYNNTLRTMPSAATPFLDGYEGHETAGSTWSPGLGAVIDSYRHFIPHALS